MLLNNDLLNRTLVHAATLDRMPSPVMGVERRNLFRVGGARARATSIVRYPTGNQFARPSHPGEEEFLPLEGFFQDEVSFPPTGSGVRNPLGSGHARSSENAVLVSWSAT